MLFWNSNNLSGSFIPVAINSLSQLFYVYAKLPPMNRSSTSSVLTHVVSKTFAGIGVLDLLHNFSAGFYPHAQPSTLIKAITGVGFGLTALSSDWIFGGCLVYDLVAIAVGQSQLGNSSWSKLLGAYAVGTAAIVVGKNFVK
jgi:hypothetical protein